MVKLIALLARSDKYRMVLEKYRASDDYRERREAYLARRRRKNSDDNITQN